MSGSFVTTSGYPLNAAGVGSHTVFYEGTGNNQLSVTNDTINGNVGVEGG